MLVRNSHSKERTQNLILKKRSFFGIQQKLFILFGFFVFALLATASYSFYGNYQVLQLSQTITKKEVPLTQGIQGALVAMLEGKIALEKALVVDDFAEVDSIREYKAQLDSSIIIFDAFLAAITWGSESEAFARSDGGLNFIEWERTDLAGKLIIQPPSQEQAQFAGVTDIYFGGFGNNAAKAIATHRRFLRLRFEGLPQEAGEARTTSREHALRALRFSGLTIGSLSYLARASSVAMAESTQNIERTQKKIQRNILFVFIVGSTVFLSAGLVFIRRSIINPLRALTRVAQEITSGHLTARTHIRSDDEMGVLGQAFNTMSDRLATYPLELKAQVEERTQELTNLNRRLQELLDGSYSSSKLLVQKDKELIISNQELLRVNLEFDEVAKVLVRRDLELTEANIRLQELDMIKSEFVSVAAHQLRTPLSGIRWSLHALLDEEEGKLNAEQRKLAKNTLAATLRMVALINDLLTIARIEEGKFGFNFVEHRSILPIVKKSYQHIKGAAAIKGIRIALKVQKGKFPGLSLDEEKISIVMDNLLDNAIKYTLPGGSITIRVSRTKQNIRVDVEDTGVGIPKKQHHRVFGKFFRADNAILLQTTGTGFGLYVARNIIEGHRGTLSFSSVEKKGSTFSFTVPITKR